MIFLCVPQQTESHPMFQACEKGGAWREALRAFQSSAGTEEARSVWRIQIYEDTRIYIYMQIYGILWYG